MIDPQNKVKSITPVATMNTLKYMHYMESAILFLKFAILLVLLTKLANFSDFSSLFKNIMGAKDYFMDSENLQELILPESTLPADDLEEIVIVEEKISLPKENSTLSPEPQSSNHLYTALKIGGAVVCFGVLAFGVYYGFSYFSSNVSEIADVANKGLDEAAKTVTKTSDTSIKAIDKTMDYMNSERTRLVKDIPRPKTGWFYRPPERK